MKFNTDIVVEKITEEEILKRTTEFDIYDFYMPTKFEIGKIMSSPFRNDQNPSFGIFKSSKTGSLLFKDQATGDIGNCFKFVKILTYKTYKEALKDIWSNIIEKNIQPSKQGKIIRDRYKNRKTMISIKRKNFTKSDDEYWGQYKITRDILKKYQVYPISKMMVNDKPLEFKYSPDNPMYAYKVYNSFKIYRPYSEERKNKWRSNCGLYDIQGWEQLPKKGDLIVITKALKDVMVLSLFNVPAIAPQGEQSLIPKEVVNELKKRFKRIVMLYDYDEGGMMGVDKMKKEYGFEHVYIPKHYLELYNVKDISDHIKEFGFNKTKKLLKELL